MNVTNKIINLLKKEKLDILESIEILRDIESAFIEHLKLNFEEMRENEIKQKTIKLKKGWGRSYGCDTPTAEIMEGKDENLQKAYNIALGVNNELRAKLGMKLEKKNILCPTSYNHDKTKCKLSINGKCTGNFSPLNCDGLDIPKECLPMIENKSEDKDG